jgi:hypothetical protein
MRDPIVTEPITLDGVIEATEGLVRTIVVGIDGSPLAGPTVARAAWLATHDDAGSDAPAC